MNDIPTGRIKDHSNGHSWETLVRVAYLQTPRGMRVVNKRRGPMCANTKRYSCSPRGANTRRNVLANRRRANTKRGGKTVMYGCWHYQEVCSRNSHVKNIICRSINLCATCFSRSISGCRLFQAAPRSTTGSSKKLRTFCVATFFYKDMPAY